MSLSIIYTNKLVSAMLVFSESSTIQYLTYRNVALMASKQASVLRQTEMKKLKQKWFELR